MNRKRFTIIILCTFLIMGATLVPLTSWFSNSQAESKLLNFMNSVCANDILLTQNVPILAKDIVLSDVYPNLDTESLLYIIIPGIKRIDRIVFNISNIYAPNHTIQIAENLLDANQINQEIHAMSFKLNTNQTCYLYNVSLFLTANLLDLGTFDIDFAVYNATWNASESRIEPDKNITVWLSNYNLKDQGLVGWKTIDITSPSAFGDVVVLDPNSTDNETFFIAIGQDKILNVKDIFWAYAPDGDDDYGPAYNWSSYELLSIDYSMIVYLSASNNTNPQVPFPQEINLQINGTAVQNTGVEGEGYCNITGNLGTPEILIFDFNSTWFDTVTFNATLQIYGTDILSSIIITSIFRGYSLGLIFENQSRSSNFLILVAIGAVAVAGGLGYRVNKKRKIPINAMRSMESILIDHNTAGILIWSFDFISMQQDIVLVSGFMSAIKSFLEEMKVGGLKRLGTEFGTFIREESQLLTATCITSEIGLDEELWIRSKLHDLLIQIEQAHYKELEDWKGEVGQFKETLPTVLASLINLEKIQKLQRHKIEKLTKNKEKLQKKVNKYGAKLEELKAKYDSGEISFRKYLIERYKTEAKYDKVQKDYLYTGLFLSRVPYALEAKPLKPKDMEKMENIQNQFLEIRKEIEDLRRKELEGTITSEDLERKEKLQKELMTLIEKLDKLHKT